MNISHKQILNYCTNIAIGAATGFANLLVLHASSNASGLSKNIILKKEYEQTIFKNIAVSGILLPVMEEVVFRGIFQPLLTRILRRSLPSISKKKYFNFPAPNLFSCLAISALFGTLHYSGYERGGAFVAVKATSTGILLGILRERFGILSSISAHVTHNSTILLTDPYI